MRNRYGKGEARSTAPEPVGDDYAYLRRRGLTQRELARGHNQGVESEQQSMAAPAASGQTESRPVDAAAGEDSMADALRRSRQAREQGDLRRAQRIMQEFRDRDDD